MMQHTRVLLDLADYPMTVIWSLCPPEHDAAHASSAGPGSLAGGGQVSSHVFDSQQDSPFARQPDWGNSQNGRLVWNDRGDQQTSRPLGDCSVHVHVITGSEQVLRGVERTPQASQERLVCLTGFWSFSVRKTPDMVWYVPAESRSIV